MLYGYAISNVKISTLAVYQSLLHLHYSVLISDVVALKLMLVFSHLQMRPLLLLIDIAINSVIIE